MRTLIATENFFLALMNPFGFYGGFSWGGNGRSFGIGLRFDPMFATRRFRGKACQYFAGIYEAR